MDSKVKKLKETIEKDDFSTFKTLFMSDKNLLKEKYLLVENVYTNLLGYVCHFNRVKFINFLQPHALMVAPQRKSLPVPNEMVKNEVFFGNPKGVEKIINNRSKGGMSDGKGGIFRSALGVCVRKENIAIIKILLSKNWEYKFDINELYGEERKKITCLYDACYIGNQKIVKLFLKHPLIDVNLSYIPPLSICIEKNNFSIAKLFLSHKKIDVNIIFRFECKKEKDSLGIHDISPLALSCLLGCEKIALNLIKRKDINVNMLNLEFVSEHAGPIHLNGQMSQIAQRPRSALGIACSVKEGMEHFSVIKALLNHKKIELVDRRVIPILYCACENNNWKVFEFLLKCKRIDINGFPTYNPLYKCTLNGNIKMVKALIDRKDIKINWSGYNPLNGAIRNGNMEIFLLLLKRKDIDVNKSVDQITKPPLLVAVENNKYNCVKLLLEHKDIQINKEAPFEKACEIGNLQIVKLFLKNKNLDVNNVYVYNPLAAACRAGRNIDVVKELLKLPNIVIQSDRFDCLSSACEGGNLEVIKLLLKHPGVDVNYGITSTPLYVARNVKVVDLLLKQKNIDVNKCAPLVNFCAEGCYEMAKRLLSHEKIDVNKVDYNGDFSLFVACENGYFHIVMELLKKEGIEVNKGIGSHTSLHHAVDSVFEDIVNALLNVDGIDMLKGSPLISLLKDDYMRESHFLIAKSLLSKMPDDNQINEGFMFCVEKGLSDYLILFLQRNVQFDKNLVNETISRNNDTKSEKIMKQFYENKSKFRHTFGKIERYSIGTHVQEYLKVAFIVGIKNYESLQCVKTAEKDAKAMNTFLKEKLKFDVTQVFIDVDEEDFKDEFDSFVLDLLNLKKKEENKYKTVMFLFYFQGLGLLYEGNSYLLPSDFDSKFFQKFNTLKKKIFRKTFSIKNLLNSIQNEWISFIILDVNRACVKLETLNLIRKMFEQNSSEEEEMKLSDGVISNIQTRGVNKKKMVKSFGNNVILVFSSDPKSYPVDRDVIEKMSDCYWKHSPLTQACISNLSKKGKLESLLIDIRTETMKLTNMFQEPSINYSCSFPIDWSNDIIVMDEKEIEDAKMKMNMDYEKKTTLLSLKKLLQNKIDHKAIEELEEKLNYYKNIVNFKEKQWSVETQKSNSLLHNKEVFLERWKDDSKKF